MLKNVFQRGILLTCLALGADDRVIVHLQGRSGGQGTGVTRWELSLDGRKIRDFRVPEGHRLVVTQAAFTVRGGRSLRKRAGHFALFLTDRSGRSELAEASGLFHAGLPACAVHRRFRPGLVVPAGAVPGVSWHLDAREPSVLSVTLYGWLVPGPGAARLGQ